jgi:hypothetical protein
MEQRCKNERGFIVGFRFGAFVESRNAKEIIVQKEPLTRVRNMAFRSSNPV